MSNHSHLINNERARDSITQFLKQIHYSSKNTPEMSSQKEVLQNIFQCAQKTHVVKLAEIRMHWFSYADPFLAQHSRPRNLSVQQPSTLSRPTLLKLQKDPSVAKDLQKALTQINTTRWDHPKQLFNILRKHTGRALLEEETDYFKSHMNCSNIQWTLHLVVSEGGMSQEIHYNKKLYLEHLNAKLQGFKVHELQCHVGNLDQMHQDQIIAGELAQAWGTLFDKDITQWCIPGFIHRPTPQTGVLVCYAHTKPPKTLPELPKQILQTITKTFPHYQYLINQITFIEKSDQSLQQSQHHTQRMGASAKQLQENQSSSKVWVGKTQESESIKPVSSLSEKEQISQIISKLRPSSQKKQTNES